VTLALALTPTERQVGNPSPAELQVSSPALPLAKPYPYPTLTPSPNPNKVSSPAVPLANELTPAELPGGCTARAQLCPSALAAGAGTAAQLMSGWPRAAPQGTPQGTPCGESSCATADAAAPAAVAPVQRTPETETETMPPQQLERRESDERFERIYRAAAPGEALTPLRHEPPRPERREG
jgi:hypothetical protein